MPPVLTMAQLAAEGKKGGGRISLLTGPVVWAGVGQLEKPVGPEIRMTKYPNPKEARSTKPEGTWPHRSFGIRVSDFLRIWVFRHSSFMRCSRATAKRVGVC